VRLSVRSAVTTVLCFPATACFLPLGSTQVRCPYPAPRVISLFDKALSCRHKSCFPFNSYVLQLPVHFSLPKPSFMSLHHIVIHTECRNRSRLPSYYLCTSILCDTDRWLLNKEYRLQPKDLSGNGPSSGSGSTTSLQTVASTAQFD